MKQQTTFVVKIMNKEEWATCTSAQHMLAELHREQPAFLATQIPQLHKFFIACSWKHKHLIPQRHLRNGLHGAENWIDGKIDDEELNRLNWYAEAECFAIDYAKSPEEMDQVRTLIEGISELSDMPFDEARKVLLKAAYFAEISMIYPWMCSLPWIESLFTSQFLCPDLLRGYILPNFDNSH